MNELCTIDTELVPFKDSITSNEFDYQTYFFTMLSIDVTNEQKNIHLIDMA